MLQAKAVFWWLCPRVCPGSSVAALGQREDTGGVCLGSPSPPGTVLSPADQDVTVQEPQRQGEWWPLAAPGPPAARMAAPSVRAALRRAELGPTEGPLRKRRKPGHLLSPEAALPVVVRGLALGR